MIGIIFYAYGAPKSKDDLPDFFAHLIQGKEVTIKMIGDFVKRYREFGSNDPLGAHSERIAQGLEKLLSNYSKDIKVYNAYKHTFPYLDETLKRMIEDGVDTVVTFSVNPIFSLSGAGVYQKEVEDFLNRSGENKKLIHIKKWNTHPAIISVYADRVRRAYKWLPAHVQDDAFVLFTVHSQPLYSEGNDDYIEQFQAMAQAVAREAGVSNWMMSYRSASSKVGWLGPDVKDTIRSLAAAGSRGFVTCELLSIVTDMESYFEIGRDTQLVSEELKVEFVRSEFPGDSFDTVIALAEIVKEQITKC
ncbi:ferrochelatase [Psychrobacillus sp. AK 1817]|uniref:ferrochelatase n=1 Tax=Psychrobacillus sp. AK 1817 TaxID=2303505 RepID=UPI001247706D|nr:ferrochelatase [Psychrobacillus sp. AK 1817]QEY21124.1 ferrochelatase [Psychrobacillus sp. AK 1817]